MRLVIAPVTSIGARLGLNRPPLGDQAGAIALILYEEWANRFKSTTFPSWTSTIRLIGANRGEFTAQNRAHPVYPIIAMPVPDVGPRATTVVNDHRPTIHWRNLVACPHDRHLPPLRCLSQVPH